MAAFYVTECISIIHRHIQDIASNNDAFSCILGCWHWFFK